MIGHILLCMKLFGSFFVFLSTIIFLIYFLNTGPLETQSHVYLSLVAFHLLWITGITWFKELTPFYMTVVFFFFGMLLSVIGLCTIYFDNRCHNTLHEWFGVFTVVFAVITWVAPVICYFVKDGDFATQLFGAFSILTMILSSITLCVGMLMDGEYHDWAWFFVLVLHVILIILYTLFALLNIVITLFY